MNRMLTQAAVLGAAMTMSQVALATTHPINGANYYEIDVQPLTTLDPITGNGIAAYNLLPFIPLPPPPATIADPFMINGFIVQSANDQTAAGIFGAWLAGHLTLQDLANMSVGTIHSECTDIGGAYAVPGNPFPPLLFKTTNNPNEQPDLVSLCTEVANFKGDHVVMTGISNKPAFEGNWQSCWTAPPLPIATKLAVTGGTGAHLKIRGELKIDAVKIEPAPGICQRPGPVKRLKWTVVPW